MTVTLFVNGTVQPGGRDWVAVDDEEILATGSGGDPAGVYRPDRVVDLQGGVLVPAFRDAHVHLPATGLYAQGMDFRGESHAGAILAAFSERADRGELLFGGNFEDPLDEPLAGADLDRAVGERPALLARADMHSAVVSSALLTELELTGLEGVDRDESGQPTGYLREQAASRAWRWFEDHLSRAQQLDAVRAAAEIAYAKGVAEVHEMFVVEWRGWGSVEVLLEATAGLALVVEPFLATTDVHRVRELGLARIGGDWFLDGSFGSHTAWMTEDFASAPPPGSPASGISYREDGEVHEFFRSAQAAGLQAAVHAIGDAAISQALSAWEKVAAEVGVEAVRGLRHRIEHFECATDEHIYRAAELGLWGSVQPAFDRFWGGADGLYAQRIGSRRAAGMNRFRTMMEAGVRLAAGSDSTVTPLDPFLQMASLRRHHEPAERVSPEVALTLTTAAPALSRGATGRGKLAPGSRADLAWLDRDPLAVDDASLLETEVLGTWIAGSRVWPPQEAETE